MASNNVSREDLLARMERAGSQPRRQPRVQIHRSQNVQPRARSTAQAGEDKRTVDQPLQFEIYTASHPDVLADKRQVDDALVQQLKAEINASGISRRDLYAFIGPEDRGGLFKNENQAYNLEYGLRGRPTITLECVGRWLAVLGKELVTVFQASDGGWFERMLELQHEMKQIVRMQRAGNLDSGSVDWANIGRLVNESEPDPHSF